MSHPQYGDMDSFSTSARSYLDRAKARLSEQTHEALIYAVLELRCGVEARLREYLEPHDHVPAGRRADWRIGNLHRTTNETFKLGDQVARIRLSAPKKSSMYVELFYTPVSRRLRMLADKFGAALHAPVASRAGADPFWPALRAEADEAAALLEEATTGTLLGPLLIDTRSGESLMPIELLEDAEAVRPLLKNLRGAEMIIDVRYFPDLATARNAP
jgi:hypothetical protein